MAPQSFKSCFVIQKFDGAAYDKRYREIFAPAIERAGAKPIRADEVLGTKPIVEKIEEGLRQADVAFAEISEDNANVFLELGIALALGMPTVIVCDKAKRSSLPFDIAHRPVTFYSTDSMSDYEKLARGLEQAIAAALLENRRKLSDVSNSESSLGDVDEVKSRCLIALLDQRMRSPVGSTLWEVQKDVASSGISERMISLALMSLMEENLVERMDNDDSDGIYHTYNLSQKGSNFLLRSYSALMQTEMENLGGQRSLPLHRTKTLMHLGDDDEIPF